MIDGETPAERTRLTPTTDTNGLRELRHGLQSRRQIGPAGSLGHGRARGLRTVTAVGICEGTCDTHRILGGYARLFGQREAQGGLRLLRPGNALTFLFDGLGSTRTSRTRRDFPRLGCVTDLSHEQSWLWNANPGFLGWSASWTRVTADGSGPIGSRAAQTES